LEICGRYLSFHKSMPKWK